MKRRKKEYPVIDISTRHYCVIHIGSNTNGSCFLDGIEYVWNNCCQECMEEKLKDIRFFSGNIWSDDQREGIIKHEKLR